MQFPWSKPSAHEVMQSLLQGFTPEEIKVLDEDECVVPHMHSSLLESSSRSILVSPFELDALKRIMNKFFYSRGDEIHDPSFQSDLYKFLTSLLRCR